MVIILIMTGLQWRDFFLTSTISAMNFDLTWQKNEMSLQIQNLVVLPVEPWFVAAKCSMDSITQHIYPHGMHRQGSMGMCWWGLTSPPRTWICPSRGPLSWKPSRERGSNPPPRGRYHWQGAPSTRKGSFPDCSWACYQPSVVPRCYIPTP
jgi:hypothetical protein